MAEVIFNEIVDALGALNRRRGKETYGKSVRRAVAAHAKQNKFDTKGGQKL